MLGLLIVAHRSFREVRGQAADELIHFDMAHDIVKTLYKKDLESVWPAF